VRDFTERRSWSGVDAIPVVRLVLVTGLLVVFGVYLRSAGIHDQTDFGVYRAGGHAILTGRDLYALRVLPLGLPFTYPPVSAMFFALLALIPVRAGQVVWMAASLAGLGVFVRLTMRRYATGVAATGTTVFLVVLILVARSDPVRVNLNFGQINVFIGLLLVADLCGALPRIPRMSTTCTSCASRTSAITSSPRVGRSSYAKRVSTASAARRNWRKRTAVSTLVQSWHMFSLRRTLP